MGQKDFHAAAAHAEAKAEAKAEADRVIMAAKAEAERVTMAAARTRAQSDRAVAEQRLLLQLKLAALTNQPYPVRTPTEKLNQCEHGEIDTQPWRNGRPDHVTTEEGAHMRGEQHVTQKQKEQQRGGVLLLIKTLERPSPASSLQQGYRRTSFQTTNT